ncbi:SDR family oxidoreductase [Streptomyces sp. A7024]|uniref:SDR family oxidoreductase n=1 Tax=Streptomyces coryli TaxID=1128680 RepID=A0A6G4UB87_9ACTN|nr:SDR family oxidoreductase [Streptomyces coryli]NGN68946.1 SDR family oxidoreductase [Streptomyces coryli]
MSIVITGATGQLGRLVVNELLATTPSADLAAVVRDPAKAADLAARGVEIRTADYDDPASLKTAFRAGDRVLLISGSEVGKRIPQHTAAIDAAKEAGVGFLAYTSILGGPAATFSLAEEHLATEKLVTGSGLPYSLLRNGWYHENYTGNLGQVLAAGAVFSAAGDGRIASAPRADFAAAAAAVLTGEGHENTTYELSGDTAWSLDEYAAEVSRQTGKDIAHTRLSPADYEAALLQAGLPAPFAATLADVDTGIARGELAATPGDLARLIGRPTGTIADAIAAAL